MKAHILIVEDEAVLYERLRMFLIKENYSVDAFTKSVKEALGRIQQKTPDLVLLDIMLDGKETGLDLGKMLFETYHIPFIYVTKRDDDESFYRGLMTHHEHYYVKTKPNLNKKELLRIIQTVLNKQRKIENVSYKGVMGLMDYKEKIKEDNIKYINSSPIEFKDILFFSNINYENTEGEIMQIKKNYLWFKARLRNKCDGKKYHETFLLESSLDNLLQYLPYDFVRINQNTIINLNSDIFKGKVNGSYVQIENSTFMITRTYKKEFDERIKKHFIDL